MCSNSRRSRSGPARRGARPLEPAERPVIPRDIGMGSNDLLGMRGEAIGIALLTKFHDNEQLFRPAFLGDKWPAVDLLVEVFRPTPKGRRGFFFAQVKTSRQGYQENGRLKISGPPREKVEALAMYQVPKYILGVDEPEERVYIAALQGNFAGMSSISNEHELTDERLTALRAEVEAFWDGSPGHQWKSQFQEKNWE